MSHGSPVFKSMFSLRFKEGHELAASSFIEVPLPDDAGYVMHILCLILHHRNDGVPDAKDLSPSQILDIAEASDKYDCTAALKFTAWCWLETAKAKLSVGERGDLLTAAYYFRNGDAFAEFGRSLIFDTEGTIWEPQSYCESPLRKLFGLLEAERKSAEQKILSFAESQIERCLNARNNSPHWCTESCRYSEFYERVLVYELQMRKLWPSKTMRLQSIQGLLNGMDQWDCPSVSSRCTPCPGKFNRSCEQHINLASASTSTQFKAEVRKIEEQVKRLCLECFRSDGGMQKVGCEHEVSKADA